VPYYSVWGHNASQGRIQCGVCGSVFTENDFEIMYSSAPDEDAFLTPRTDYDDMNNCWVCIKCHEFLCDLNYLEKKV